MKNAISLFFIILFTLFGCSGESVPDKPMNLTGEVSEDGRTLKTRVVFRNGSIVDITISGIADTDTEAKAAAEQTAYKIISKQSLSVDVASAETEISQNVIRAVSAALESGGIASELFRNRMEPLQNTVLEQETTYDVVVIGSGAAGLSAAVQAAQNGYKVLVLEKMPMPGGSTYMSGAEMSIPENVLSINQPHEDSPENMIKDILEASENTANKELVSIICNNIADSAIWLKEYVHVMFNNDFYIVNGHSVPRSTFPDGGGAALINHMIHKAEELGVHILYNMNARELIQNENGGIIGVMAKEGEDTRTFYARQRLVIATGGFSSNKSMREEYNQQLRELNMDILSSGPQGNTGDGISMGLAVGAAVVDLQYIQFYHHTNPATGIHFYMDNKRIDAGAFYINREGQRFIREDLTRMVVSLAVLEQTDSTMYEIFTQDILEKFCINELALKEFNQWIHQGVIAKGETIGECADFFSLDPKEAAEALSRYNRMIQNGYDEDFGRKMDYPMLDKGPYYMLEGVPSIHYTLGGLKIDEHARVLDQNDTPIPGLYAAGEVTGGIFGKDRLGACAIPDALVFGRIAGGYEIE